MTCKQTIKAPLTAALAALAAIALSACGGGDGQTPQTSPDSRQPGSVMERPQDQQQPPAGSAQEEPGMPPGQTPDSDGSSLGDPGMGGQQQ